MKIVLVNPFVDEHFAVHLPLGLAYLASILRERGCEVEAWDFHTSPKSTDEIRNLIKNTDADLIGISSMIRTFQQAKEIAQLAREEKPEINVVIGGAGATSMPEALLNYTGADYLMTGECEESIIDFLDMLNGTKEKQDVPGLVWKQESEIIRNRPSDIITDVDSLPFPAWDLFDMREITRKSMMWEEGVVNPDEIIGQVSIIASRGCPYRCIYCDHSIKGYGHRQRSVDTVVEEIKILHHQYSAHHLYFWDDIFTLNEKWVFEFCDRLEKENLNITWTCNGHVNHGSSDLYKRMKSAGCYSVRFGIESGSERILKALKKGVTKEAASQAIKDVLANGMTPVMYIMLGMIDETEEDMLDTIAFIKEVSRPLKYDDPLPAFEVFLLTPIPGTKLFELAKKRGFIEDESYVLKTKPDFWEKLAVNMSKVSSEKIYSMKKTIESEIRKMLDEKQNRVRKAILEMATEAGLQ